MLERLPAGSRETNLTLTTDNGTQFTSSRFHGDAGTAEHHAPAYGVSSEGNSYTERFHRSLKKEVWTTDYRNLEEARRSIARWIEEYNHDRPHYGVGNRTPNEAFLSFAVLTKTRP